MTRTRGFYCHGHRRASTQEAVWFNVIQRNTHPFAPGHMDDNIHRGVIDNCSQPDTNQATEWIKKWWYIYKQIVVNLYNRILCWFAGASLANYHKLGGFKSQKSILSQFRRPERKIKISAGLVPSGGSE